MQRDRVTGTEQYYTPGGTSGYCVEVMSRVISGGVGGKLRDKMWLEPAGGTGSFIDALVASGINLSQIVSYDIEPKHPACCLTGNFLDEDISSLSGCITLTNPPFGRANKLSIPFFNKCAQVAIYIGFIVPKSWRKWSVIDRLDPYFHCVHDEELSIDYVYDGDKASKGKLSTVFQIWEKRGYVREKIQVEDRGYIKKVKPQDADVSLTIFGRGCGRVKVDFARVGNTTQMFLKVADDAVLDALRSVDFSRFYNNVAFIEALSIREINFLLNEYFDGLADGV
jgi:predicted RNA methylase